jgi:hypothetical protein
MTTFEIVMALIVGILSVARTARLIAWDEYPPIVAFRVWHDDRWGEEGWGKLVHCQYCMTPYLAAGMALWFWLAFAYGGDTAQGIWWGVNGVWGLSYLSAIVVSYDSPE